MCHCTLPEWCAERAALRCAARPQWTVGVGYTAADYQAALTLNDKQTGARCGACRHWPLPLGLRRCRPVRQPCLLGTTCCCCFQTSASTAAPQPPLSTTPCPPRPVSHCSHGAAGAPRGGRHHHWRRGDARPGRQHHLLCGGCAGWERSACWGLRSQLHAAVVQGCAAPRPNRGCRAAAESGAVTATLCCCLPPPQACPSSRRAARSPS